MSGLQVHVLNHVGQLASIADRWNDLWQRSDATCPQSRVELICHWIHRFAPSYRFRAIVIEDGNRLVAALPLVTRPWATVVPVGTLPRNHWCGAGDLLVDPESDRVGAIELLAKTLNKLPWIVYRFSFICSETETWQQFARSLHDTECHVECRPSHDVSRIEIPRDWESYRRTWSSDHRYRIRRAQQQLGRQGELRMERHVPTTMDDAAPLLRRVMEIEDMGWKGQQGTSILKTPNMAEFITGMSASLIARRELEIVYLRLNDDVVAAEIIWNAKGVLHGYKTGYDERFRKYAPGYLLMHEILREACETKRCHAFDCMGQTSEALQHWRGSLYRIGQLTFATRKWAGQALSFLYRRVRRGGREPILASDASQSQSPTVTLGEESSPAGHEVCNPVHT